jgi:hypothetical protein
VHAVRADNDVVMPALSALEADVDAGAVVLDRFDRIVETITDCTVPGQRVEERRQRAALQFDIPRLVGGQVVDGNRPNRLPCGINESHGAGADMRRLHGRQQPHPLDHVDSGAADVDGIAAAAHGGRALHHRYLEAVAVEPIGQRGARNARTRNQDGPGSLLDECRGHGTSLTIRMHLASNIPIRT